MTQPPRLQALRRPGFRRVAAACGLLLASACSAKSATYRWGGIAAAGRYVVNMDTLKRTGSRVDFTALFMPEPTAQTPALADLYVRAGHWIDCASGLQERTSSQSFRMDGTPIDAMSGADAAPTPIGSGSTWSSVRDLVCTGHNDLSLPPLVGTDPQVATAVRARMASHPVKPG